MSRSVYSLVLTDGIVKAVDRLAYERGTSRSNLINQILAEYLSCPTPEMRMKNIFEGVEQMMAEMDSFQLQFQPSDAMISIRSALHYRYNPSLRYVLELYRESGPTVGELRVSARTQNRTLIQILTEFFEFWAGLEQRLAGSKVPKGRVYHRIETGRYTREFLTPRAEGPNADEDVANAIAAYIQLFDQSLKLYFADLENPETACAEIEDNYRNHLRQAVLI